MARDLLLEIHLLNSDVGDTLADLPWMTDGIVDMEFSSLESLLGIVMSDLELSRRVIGYAWFADGFVPRELQTLDNLEDIAAQDLAMAKAMSEYFWIADDVGNHEAEAIDRLRSAALGARLELARLVALLPWLGDDLTDIEVVALDALLHLTERSVADGRVVVALPWVTDGITGAEALAVDALRFSPRLREDVSPSADSLTGLPDAINGLDGLTGEELMRALVAIAVMDPWLGWIALHHALGLPEGSSVIQSIEKLVWVLDTVDPGHFPWALKVAEYVATAKGGLGPYLLHSMEQLALHSPPDVAGQLSNLAWIADGIDDEEAALLIPLYFLVGTGRESFDDLLRDHSTQSITIALPLAGDINIWLVKRQPFSSDDKFSSIAETSVRAIEELIGIPFPTTDMIVLLVDDAAIPVGGYYLGNSVIVRESWSTKAIAHELAHYYGFSSPRWFREGLAEFARAYVDQWSGVQSLDDRWTDLSPEVDQECFKGDGFEWQEIDNLWHVTYLLENRRSFVGDCHYLMGEHFLLAVVNAIGESAFSSAIKDLYLSNQRFADTFGVVGQTATDERIYKTFLQYTPAGLRREFRNLYSLMHGGSYSDLDVDVTDDHADEIHDAYNVTVGEVATGRLDYRFDFDYFRFHAEEGQRIEISVDHETLRASSAALFNPAGHEVTTAFPDIVKTIRRTPSGFQLLWIAAESGDHYFAVRNFGGYTGSYTLRIIHRVDVPDDHGDTLATATGLTLGETVEGVSEDHFDLDYFWFSAEAGKEYRVQVSNVKIELMGARLEVVKSYLYNADGTLFWGSSKRGEIDGFTHIFVPSNSQRYYVRLENFGDVVGHPYTLTVHEVPAA